MHNLKIGQVAYIAFLLTGWSTQENSKIHLEVDCKIINPDGSVLFDLPKYATFRGMIPQAGFVMADPALDFQTGKGDQLGTYRVLATAHDRLSGKSVKGEYSFTVKE